jgi:hypothetical protein
MGVLRVQVVLYSRKLSTNGERKPNSAQFRQVPLSYTELHCAGLNFYTSAVELISVSCKKGPEMAHI